MLIERRKGFRNGSSIGDTRAYPGVEYQNRGGLIVFKEEIENIIQPKPRYTVSYHRHGGVLIKGGLEDLVAAAAKIKQAGHYRVWWTADRSLHVEVI